MGLKKRTTLGQRIAGAFVSHFISENQSELERLAHVVAHTAHVAKRRIDAVRDEGLDAHERMKARREKRRSRQKPREESSDEPIALVQGEDGVWRTP